MKVKVLLFARLREIAGREMVVIDVPQGSTLGELWGALQREYPPLAAWSHPPLMARDREYATAETILEGGEEVAFLPPVSGGKDAMLFRIVTSPIKLDELVKAVRGPGIGAMATFLGSVRDHNEGKSVISVEYHAYPEMAEKVMREIGEEVRHEYSVERVAMAHRVGRLAVGETSVALVVGSEHRRQALEALAHAIERLKQRVPVWKREFYADGSAWLEPGPASSHVAEKSGGGRETG